MTSHTETTTLRGGKSECVRMRTQSISQPRPAMKEILHIGSTRELVATTPRQRGKVVWFNDAKGFGFIRPAHGCTCSCHTVEGARGVYAGPCVYCQGQHEKDVYVHFSAIDSDPAKRRKLLPEQRVEYTAIETKKGPQAQWVKVVSA